MDALLSAALKVSTLPDKDKEWIYNHLSKRQASLLREKVHGLSQFKKLKKLSCRDIAKFNPSEVASSKTESVKYSEGNSIDKRADDNQPVFSVLDQYQQQSVIKAFEQLPPIIVASYLSSGDKKWLDIFGSHAINGKLIDYRSLALTQNVPRATAREVANIIYEKTEAIENGVDL